MPGCLCADKFSFDFRYVDTDISNAGSFCTGVVLQCDSTFMFTAKVTRFGNKETKIGLGGFVPGGPGIPYAFEYALKCLDIEAKFRKGEKWEYLPQPKFDHGVF